MTRGSAAVVAVACAAVAAAAGAAAAAEGEEGEAAKEAPKPQAVKVKLDPVGNAPAVFMAIAPKDGWRRAEVK